MATQKLCENCGSTIETFEYQARSADEAHRTVTVCPSCPIEVERIDCATSPLSPPPIRSMKPSRPENAYPTSRRPLSLGSSPEATPSTHVSTEYLLSVKAHFVTLNASESVIVSVARAAITGTLGTAGQSFRLPRVAEVTSLGPLDKTCSVIRRDNVLAQNSWAKVSLLDIYETLATPDLTPFEIRYHCVEGPVLCGLRCFYVQELESTNVRLVVRVQGTMDLVWEIIDAAHCEGVLPRGLGDILSSADIGKLSNLSPRAWDSPDPMSGKYLYTFKVDGERAWAVIFGRMLYYVTRHGHRRIMAWSLMSKCDGEDTSVVVLDVEFLGIGKSLLIDVLMDAGFAFAPTDRGLHWTIEKWSAVKVKYPTLPVEMRPYYASKLEASRNGALLRYPVDGIVAVSVKNPETLKLKDVKSVELRVKGSTMMSEDHEPILSFDHDNSFEDGAIIELRLAPGSTESSFDIKSVIFRPDKVKANDAEACREILRQARLPLEEPTDIQRRAATSWCNTLRNELLRQAWNKPRTGGIILDIGSGSGQALDSFYSIPDASVIFVEPDEAKCKFLARRRSVHTVKTDPLSLIPLVSSLHTGKVKYVVYNGTASSIIECEDLMRTLSPRIRCITSTFSIQFVAAEMRACRARKLPFVGCCYFYDNADRGGKLVEAAGVSMKITEDGRAGVKWGGDKVYDEPALLSRVFRSFCKVHPGYQYVPLPDPTFDKDARAICSEVYVVTS